MKIKITNMARKKTILINFREGVSKFVETKGAAGAPVRLLGALCESYSK